MQVLTERQQYAEGEKLFDEAIRREPKHAALLVHKGNEIKLNVFLRSIIIYYNRFVLKFNITILLALLILQSRAEIEPAKQLIREALELDSDCEFAYETIATIEMQMYV